VKRAVLLHWLAVAGLCAAGCGGSRAAPPTGPTAGAPVAPTTQGHLKGFVVDDGGAPVAGATVVTYGYGTQTSAISDDAGFYDIEFMNGAPTEAAATKDGFERTLRYVNPTSLAGPQTLRLYRIERITAGANRTVMVAVDDPICGLEDEWTCRTIRVVAPRAGTMHIELTAKTAPAAFGLAVGMVNYPCCARSASVAMKAGDEISALILLAWTSPVSVEFTLATSLE
jgi:Carboxypeptidase regulatory-like domain